MTGYINARARDMILVSAENVAPTEVEYVLEEHPMLVRRPFSPWTTA
ncbi:MAG TPA: hypothetical protein VI365_15635 [Trebonia sp.]